MSANRRFFPLISDEDPFVFEIDTRNIVAGATNGSENNLTFKIPLNTIGNEQTRCIVRVSDGRPDVDIVGQTDSNTKSLLTFAMPGVYTIKIYGRVGNFTFYAGTVNWDLRKIIKIKNFSPTTTIGLSGFYRCSNLVVDISKTYRLPVNSQWLFREIKAINSSLQLFDTSKVNNMAAVAFGISEPLKSTFNPFFKSLISVTGLYTNSIFTPEVDKIEIISNSVTSLYEPWHNVIFQNTGNIRLIVKTPNLKKMFRVFYTGHIQSRCHAGEIDVRNVTETSEWLRLTFSTAQVDETLKGWANLPFMQAGVVWDWINSKYSNTPEVVAAYNKITQQWGVVFNRLTMA